MPDSSPDALFPEEVFDELRKLEKKALLARWRYPALLLIPLLWILGGVLISFGSPGELEVGILLAWFFLTLFGVSGYVFLVCPTTDEVQLKYATLVVPLLFETKGLTANYYTAHDLKMAAVLKSGLMHEQYSTMLREDSIVGKSLRMEFGMYQVAIQKASGFGSARYSGGTRVLTNQFFGWVIHCVIPSVRGTHVILPLRKTGDGESEDWIVNTVTAWKSNTHAQRYSSGNTVFDQLFHVYTNDVKSLASFAAPEFLEFLRYLQSTATNSFAISISGNLFVMQIGISSLKFRLCPSDSFTQKVHPDLMQEVVWYSDLFKGIERVFYK